jgi:ABC-type proline/glycine betaine transport system substrate-binding protein
VKRTTVAFRLVGLGKVRPRSSAAALGGLRFLRRFTPETRSLEVGALYNGQAQGSVDIQTNSWLPATHASYWAKYKDRLEDYGSWCDETSLEIAVPSYVKGEYRLIKSNTSAMPAQLDRAHQKKEPTAVTLWSPHWAYDKYDLTKLEDPEGAFGAGDGIHTLGRKGFAKDEPQVARWLKDFKLTKAGTSSMLAELDRDYAKKEPIAVVLWSPHWAYDKYDLTRLADPEKTWGANDQIRMLAHRDSPRSGSTRIRGSSTRWPP